MHEMALSEGVLQILQDNARTQGFARVRQIWLEIGRLAGVDVKALRFSFDVVVRGTLAERATLNIVSVAGTAWCMPCGANVSVNQRFDACPVCGSHQLQITGGADMRIKELEVE